MDNIRCFETDATIMRLRDQDIPHYDIKCIIKNNFDTNLLRYIKINYPELMNYLLECYTDSKSTSHIKIRKILEKDPTNFCKWFNCTNIIGANLEFCSEHTCIIPLCTHTINDKYVKNKGLSKACCIHSCIYTGGCVGVKCGMSDYCKMHKCISEGCDNGVYQDCKYCELHKCILLGCHNCTSDNGKYCTDHICSYDNCKEFTSRATKQKFCKSHECVVRNCCNCRSDISKYCLYHKCIVSTCTNSKSGQYTDACANHICVNCGCVKYSCHARHCDTCRKCTCYMGRIFGETQVYNNSNILAHYCKACVCYMCKDTQGTPAYINMGIESEDIINQVVIICDNCIKSYDKLTRVNPNETKIYNI